MATIEIKDTSATLLAKHCQAVHFYLLALCIALGIFGSVVPSSKIERARQDLEAIELLCRNWRSSWQEVGDAISRDYPKPVKDLPRLIIANVEDGGFGTSGRWWIVPTRWSIPGVMDDGQDVSAGFKAPRSLPEFRVLWEKLRKRKASFRLALSIDPVLTVRGVGGDEHNVRWTSSAVQQRDAYSSTSLIVLPLTTSEACGPRSQRRSSELILCSVGTWQSLIVEGDFVQFDLEDLQKTLASRALKRPLAHGSFEESFPELEEMAADLQGLTFANLKRVLANEAERSKGELSWGGAQIPARGFSPWGAGGILMGQLYFFLLLRRLFASLGLDAVTREFPWFALFPDELSRTCFVVSITLAPVASLWLLLNPSLEWKPGVWVLTATSILIAGLSVFVYRRGMKSRDSASKT